MLDGSFRRSLAAMTTLLAVSVLMGACATAKAGPPASDKEPGGMVITREQIEGMHVRTALEVVERSARHLEITRTKDGEPVRIFHRGVDSFLLSARIQVVVDGAVVSDGVHALDNIPSASIEFIQILSGREAVIKYGALGGNGVILVKTTAGWEWTPRPAISLSPRLPSARNQKNGAHRVVGTE